MTSPELAAAAQAWGVHVSHIDGTGARHEASEKGVVQVLGLLGAPMRSARDAPKALLAARTQYWTRTLEPVTVAWTGQAVRIRLRMPMERDVRRVEARLELETGRARGFRVSLKEAPILAGGLVKGKQWVEREMVLPVDPPEGYHKIAVRADGRQSEGLLIRAPPRAFSPRRRGWGVFAPVYALKGDGSGRPGTLKDLRVLLSWVKAQGASFVASLPLLAAATDGRVDPSPYAPLTRRLWNELYLDLPGGDEGGTAWRRDGLIDYDRAAKTCHERLRRAYRSARADPPRVRAFRAYLRRHPTVERYATFRACRLRHGPDPSRWPERLREGRPRPTDYDRADRDMHAFAQFLLDEQLGALRPSKDGRGVHFDLPLSVAGDAFDVWDEGDLFVRGASIGAPPDAFFAAGQEWGLKPLHPRRSRETGHQYFLECLRAHLRYAAGLRIDHVMQFHRLYWVPVGQSPKEGVYVEYPAEEFYAILALESVRHRVPIVGEDLGTVPNVVRRSLENHGILRSHVLQLEALVRPGEPPSPAPRDSLASLSTHDMWPFAGFWNADDLRFQAEHGLLPKERVPLERMRRKLAIEGLRLAFGLDGAERAFARLQSALAASDAALVLVNLEDAWGERRPQNYPGNPPGHTSFRRPFARTLKEIRQDPQVRRLLKQVDASRRGGRR